jgi:hypothetical protein
MQNYELYENILVRHGLMPMSCGASTKANQILGMSLTNMKEQGLEEKSVFYMMNPRSIFIGQFDPVCTENNFQKRLENRLVSPRPIGKPEP